MNVSNIRIRNLTSEGKLKALVSVVVDDCIAIHEIKIIQTEQKAFIVMPSSVSDIGEDRDIVHPINSDTRKALEDAILTAYHSCRCDNDLYL